MASTVNSDTASHDEPPAPPPPEPPPPEPPPEISVDQASSTSTSEPSTTPIRLAMYNIQSGQAGCLEMACRALEGLNVDLCFFTEAKLTGIHTRFTSGYHVEATKALAHNQGGVALVYRLGLILLTIKMILSLEGRSDLKLSQPHSIS